MGGTPISLQLRASDAVGNGGPGNGGLGNGGPGGDGTFVDELFGDELFGDETWTSLGVAVEEGPWPGGTATVGLRTTTATGASFEVGEIRIVVDGEPALTLTASDLARLAV